MLTALYTNRTCWPYLLNSLVHLWASPHQCQLVAAAVSNRGEFVGNFQIFGWSGGRHKLRASGSHCLLGKLLPLKITGWSFAHPSKSLTPHEIHAILTPAKRWPQISTQDLFFYPIFCFAISLLCLVTPFADLVSRIRTKGLCAALVWIHLTFSRGFTEFANYKNCKYIWIREFWKIKECNTLYCGKWLF